MKIPDPEYQAIAIDTNILEKYHWVFKKGVLQTLEQFKENEFEYIIPRVIANEMEKHFTSTFEKRKSESKKGIKALKGFFDVNEEVFLEIATMFEDDTFVKEKINKFYVNTGAQVIECSDINCSDLVEMYSKTIPPFEKDGHKKAEFPDAIALLTLERWAEDNDAKVMAVSEDNGWLEYGKTSKSIDVVKDLPKAIEHFQPTYMLDRIRAYFQNPEIDHHEMMDDVKSEIQRVVEETDVDPEADSAFYFDVDECYATLENISLTQDENDLFILSVIEIEKDSVVIELHADVDITVYGSFSLYVKDSIDKDYVPMGISTPKLDRREFVRVLVKFEGDLTDELEALDITNIEVENILDDVDFGEIEPDWYYYGEREL